MNDRETKHNDAAMQQNDATTQQHSEAETTNASTRTHAHEHALRLFAAIELSPNVRASAAAHVARLRASLPDVRASWERDEKLHITLKFFGDIERSRTHALSLAAERAAQSIAPFTLDIADAGAFPPHGNPRVLWLGVHDASGALAHLQQALENESAAAGFKREPRPFHPHITLARLRHPAGTRQLAALHKELGFPSLELPVNELVLMRSELGPYGSRYTVFSHYRLSK